MNMDKEQFVKRVMEILNIDKISLITRNELEDLFNKTSSLTDNQIKLIKENLKDELDDELIDLRDRVEELEELLEEHGIDYIETL